MFNLLEQLKISLIKLLNLYQKKMSTPDPIVPMTLVPLQWDTPEHVRHSVRVICDEQALNVIDKNIITACVEQESQFDTQVIHENFTFKQDPNDPTKKIKVLDTTDYGIVQINDFFHIGPGKDFPTSEYVLSHPEECVLFMIKCFKAGHLNWWVSYSSGAYKKYLP